MSTPLEITNRLWQIKHQLMDLIREAKEIVKANGIEQVHEDTHTYIPDGGIVVDMPSAAPGVTCFVQLNADRDTLIFQQDWDAIGHCHFTVIAGIKH